MSQAAKKREKIAGWQKATVCYGERDEARLGALMGERGNSDET